MDLLNIDIKPRDKKWIEKQSTATELKPYEVISDLINYKCRGEYDPNYSERQQDIVE